MQTLLTVHESDIRPGTTDAGPAAFSHREAARAVVINEQGQIALLKVIRHNVHKLPGGGIEFGEDVQQALRRELLEEIGCEVKVLGDIGQIVEFRDAWNMKQTSYCYVAKQRGQQQPPAFTEEELRDDFKMMWADSIDAAIVLLESDAPADYDAQFMQKRDLEFLKRAKSLLPF